MPLSFLKKQAAFPAITLMTVIEMDSCFLPNTKNSTLIEHVYSASTATEVGGFPPPPWHFCSEAWNDAYRWSLLNTACPATVWTYDTAVSHSHLIIICGHLCWVSTSKVKGEAGRRLQMVTMLTPCLQHRVYLITTNRCARISSSKQTNHVKLHFMATLHRCGNSGPNYHH